MLSKPKLCINPKKTARQHPSTNSRNFTSPLQQTIPISQSQPRLRYSNERGVMESNYAAKSLRLLLMIRYSVSGRCISIRTFQHFEIAGFPLSCFPKPHRRSPWRMASTTSFVATPRWILRTIAEHMYLVCPILIVRNASFDQVVKALFT